MAFKDIVFFFKFKLLLLFFTISVSVRLVLENKTLQKVQEISMYQKDDKTETSISFS